MLMFLIKRFSIIELSRNGIYCDMMFIAVQGKHNNACLGKYDCLDCKAMDIIALRMSFLDSTMIVFSFGHFSSISLAFFLSLKYKMLSIASCILFHWNSQKNDIAYTYSFDHWVKNSYQYS